MEHERVENDGQAPPESLGSSPEDGPPSSRPVSPDRSTNNVIEDVIGKKGQYGRFAERWFSRKGWTTEKRRAQGMSTADEEPRSASTQDALQNPDATNDAAATPVDLNSSGQTTKRDKEKQRNESPPDNQTANVVNTLLPKLLRTTRMLLSSRSFFFSYDLDITRRLGNQNTKSSELSLHKSVDLLVSRGLHSF